MRVFRSTYRAPDGATRSTPRWYVEVAVFGRVRRMAAFGDKAASTALGRNVERLAQHVEAGGGAPADLTRWLDSLSARVRAKLGAWGLLDPRRAAVAQPLGDLLDEWERAVLDAGRTVQHARLSRQRAAMVLDAIGAARWSDVGAEAVQRYLATRRREGLSARSSNHMLGAVRGLARWMVRTGRAGSDPLAELRPVNVETDRRRERRALTPSEAHRLIRAAETSCRTVDRLAGEQRALVYRVALGTGLRRAELARIRVGDFDLERRLLSVPAAAPVLRRRAELPLPEALCAELAERFAGMPADRPALPLRRNWRSDRIIDADRARAGIPRLDERGRVLDFHALRVTYISWLAAGGAHQSVAQALARHSDARLTHRVYTDLPAAQVAAVAALPDLRPGNSAPRSAVAVSGHVRSRAPKTGLAGSHGGGSRTRTDESRICNPLPGGAAVVDLTGVTSLAISDSADCSAEEIRALTELVAPAGMLAALDWLSGMQEVAGA